MKKDVKFKIAAKNHCDGRLIAKIFNNDNSGEFSAESYVKRGEATQIQLNCHY